MTLWTCFELVPLAKTTPRRSRDGLSPTPLSMRAATAAMPLRLDMSWITEGIETLSALSNAR